MQTWQFLPFGQTVPTGALAQRMRRDLAGFVGHLDALVPDLICEDDIYGRDRLTAAVRTKDLGAATDGEDTSQLLWWNSETQSNWRDGWVRHIMAVGTPEERDRVRAYVEGILDTADPDGYLGIYAPELRYRQVGENGELWAQATLGRALLGYAEATPDREHGQAVIEALCRAMQVTMAALPVGSQPFGPAGYSGSTHGLMLTDVLVRLTELTGDTSYREYAAWLYTAYSMADPVERDVTLPALRSPGRFIGHGVHTYEHLRALLVAADMADSDKLWAALGTYLDRLAACLTPASGPIGDERILGRLADASVTGYEFCSIQEVTDSLLTLIAATSDPSWADVVESVLVNAAAGAWHPTGGAIAYLQTDNATEMTGSRPWDPLGAAQTRYRYSPVHREAAVCCVPNAGRLLPTALRGAVMRTPEGLTLLLYAPLRTRTHIDGVEVEVSVDCDRIAPWTADIRVRAQTPVRFELALRRPGWAEEMTVDAVPQDDSPVQLDRVWHDDLLTVTFSAGPRIERDEFDGAHVAHGPRVLALPIPDETTEAAGELLVRPTDDSWSRMSLLADAELVETGSDVLAWFTTDPDAGPSQHRLVPLGETALRQLTFPVSSTQ